MQHVNELEPVLEVRDLEVSFPMLYGEVKAVNGISYTVSRGEVMGIVGESGSGKSVEAYSIMGLLKAPGKVNGGSALLEGRDLLKMSQKKMQSIRGHEIGMIFQNPMSCLDPVFTIGRQMTETLLCHNKSMQISRAEELSQEMLKSVGINDAKRLMGRYPFELSGGMRQRVMIAIALLCNPKLLIADEPTTALDVTIQAQIVQLLKKIQKQTGMSMVYITHNLGIIAELCDKVAVMYGGRILEYGTVDDIFYRPAHPYTKALLNSIPRIDAEASEPLASIKGSPVNPANLPVGCAFHPRCSQCKDMCSIGVPPVTQLSSGHSACCWLLNDTDSQACD